jgi:O-antigen ligase
MSDGMPVEETRALPAARSARAAAPAARGAAGRAVLGFVYLWWVLIVMEPDWFLFGALGGPFYRIPQLLAPILLLVLARYATRRAVYLPFALFLLLHVLALFYAENRGYVFGSLKTMFYIFATCVAVAALANTPARVVTLLRIYLLGFVWYGLQGLPSGRVAWHTLMANEDSYGPLMVIGLGFSYNFAAATRARSWRLLAHATALLCCVGVVRSFARGAVLSFALVLGLLWLRARHKLRAFALSLVAVGVTLVAIDVIFPEGEFWAEMRTISEGTEAGTGQTRWIMWKMALQIFAHHPIFGVGAGNFGVNASQEISYDPSRPEFGDPARLYNMALHNLYMQILSEEGILGFALFCWMTLDCFLRLRRLRTAPALATWHRRGGEMDLRSLSFALELSMIAFLANAVFYNQLYIHWFWTLVTLAFTLTRVALPDAARARSPSARRARAGAARAPAARV